MTKAWHEKTLARRLFDWRRPVYLPLMRRKASHHGRTVTVTLPLFPGCVLLYGSEQDGRLSQQPAEVRRVAAVGDSTGMFQDLRHVHRLMTSDARLTVESRLPPGRRVRVQQGALAGMEGIVFQRRDETRLLVAVRSLERGASIAVEGFLVEPMDSR